MKWNSFKNTTIFQQNRNKLLQSVSGMVKIREDAMRKARDILEQAFAGNTRSLDLKVIIADNKNLNKKKYEMESIQK